MSNLSITALDVSKVEMIEQDTKPAGEAITAGQVVREDATTGKWYKAGASGESTARGVALKSAAAGQTVTALRKGLIGLGAALAGLSYDDPVYLSDTEGTMATTSGTAEVIVGRVTSFWTDTTPAKVLRVDL